MSKSRSIGWSSHRIKAVVEESKISLPLIKKSFKDVSPHKASKEFEKALSN